MKGQRGTLSVEIDGLRCALRDAERELVEKDLALKEIADRARGHGSLFSVWVEKRARAGLTWEPDRD